MTLVVRACLIVVSVVAATFLPFVSGGYDFLASPISAMAWILGRVGLLLVPIGAFWLWDSRHGPGRERLRWLTALTLAACVVISLAIVLVAFAATSSLLLSAGVALIAEALTVRVAGHLREIGPAAPLSKVAMGALVIGPLVVWGAQSMLVEPITTRARNRVISNAAPLIAEIERYRARHGTYPASLFSIWGDYKPAILGVERYHYEPSGEAYNVIFREPALGFGIRRFVVYNPTDKQRVTVHEQDRLLLDEAGLEADNAGYTVIEALPQPHWKALLFLS